SFVAFAAINQVNKVADFVVGLLLEQLEIRVAFLFFGKSFEEIGRRSAELLLIFVPICALTRAPRKTNLFLAHVQFREITRKPAARAPEIDLEGERVLPWPGVDHPLQWRVGDDASIPIILAIDIGRRETRRQ